MLKLYKLKDYNFRLIFFLILLSGIGITLVNSADPSLRNRQMIGVILGVILMVIVSLIDYSWILNFYWIIYVFTVGMLFLVAVLGHTAGGATRWLTIGGAGGLQFQPTEIAKITLVLFFAMFLMKHEEDLNTLKTILKAVVLIAVPLVLILVQPD